MIHARRILFLLLLLTGALGLSAEEKVTPEQAEFFEKKIRPVFANNCYECHGPDAQEANLRLDKFAAVRKGGDTGPAVTPGKLAQSEIVAAIKYEPDGYQMPPDGKLPQADIDNIIAWIEMGAPWPGADKEAMASGPAEFNLEERKQHWAYQPVKDVVPPEVENEKWVQTPVDTFILKKLREANLSPAPAADKRTLLRRITFDLTGLPPTPAELTAFLADKSPDAFAKVVDRLLASPAYGERWGRHWLDLVRFAETAGHEFDYEIPYAWRYRDYIIRALNEDLPYNQLIVEHLAGDLLEQPRRRPESGENESILATGFYWFAQGKHSPVDIRAEECDTVDNQIDVLSKTFLGSSIACARCHDHKFDPITTADYYSLAGFLQSSRRDLALLNPLEETTELAASIRETRQRTGPFLRDVAIEKLREQIKTLPETLTQTSKAWLENPQADGWPKYLTEVVNKDESHPLYLWAQLVNLKQQQVFLERKNLLLDRWTQRATAAKQLPASAVVFEDFNNDALPGWFASGPAFETSLVNKELLEPGDSASTPVSKIWEAGTINSGLAGGKWEGAIRSPTFEIARKNIWYRVRRIGGNDAPGRKHKNGQISLIVDGFQLIQNPLYGMLTLNVPNNGQPVWLRQDVSKFPGHKAYIEFEDSDDGILIVDEIVFSDEGIPPEPPNSLALELLQNLDIDSPETLAAAYQAKFFSLLNEWEGESLFEEQANHRAAWLNWLLESNLIESPNAPSMEQQQIAERVLSSERALQQKIPAPEYALAITDGTPENEHILIRGQHKKPGREVPRGYMEAFYKRTAPISTSTSGRLELARKIASPDNPLTTRVIVNRLWQHHFGRGIVESVDDFGHMGKTASHPQLLDWLANQLVANDWSLKAMHRLMVLSAAYQMQSDITNPQAEQADPQNLLLHRMYLQRLEGEAIRDAILQISGRLDSTLYGPSVMPHLTPFMEGRGRPGQSGPLDGAGRRSLYINVRRNFLTPMFLAFDFPTPFTTAGKRSVSNVPAQALTLMNNEFVIAEARRWAEHLLQVFPATPQTQEKVHKNRIKQIYETALSRPPTAAEVGLASEFLKQQANEYNTTTDDLRVWADFCHVVYNLKEFSYVR